MKTYSHFKKSALKYISGPLSTASGFSTMESDRWPKSLITVSAHVAKHRKRALQTHTANLLASFLFSHVECLRRPRLKMARDIIPKLVTQACYVAEQPSTTATSQFDCFGFFFFFRSRPSGVSECLQSFRIGCRR